jgi:hypothetical protein
MGTPLVLSQQIDSTTWQALGLVLTLIGLALSVVVWRRSGPGRGLRAAGWSLVPLAAGLTGLLRLAWEVLDSALHWAVGMVFSPLAWIGLGVAAVALALHVAGSLLLRRGAPDSAGSGRSAVGAGAGGGLSGAPPPTSSAGATGRRRSGRKQEVVEDQDDIEAILRRHGIE